MAALSIRLLGGLTIEVDGTDRTAQFSGRLRGLLAFLLLNAGSALSRQNVAFTLWPDSSEKQARTNLRKLILLLRAALGPQGDYLIATDHTVGWRSDEECWLDTDAFANLIAASQSASATAAIDLLCAAVELYRGDLLPDCYDEWIVAAREATRDHYLNALDRLCALFEGEGRYAEGVAAARRLLQHDPVYERGHLHLIRLQAMMNDRAGALQSYHRCATLLRRELGVDPSPALEELYLQLLDATTPAPISSAVEQASSIPLVGRREAWSHLLAGWQQAQAGKAHFTLIAGEAGIGKSRLAEEIMLWVERQGNVVAHGRAYGSDNRTLTYAPVAALLRVPAIRSEVMRLQPTWLTEIARLLPEVLIEHPEITPPQPMRDDWQRHHLFAALTHALQPKRLPRLLVIDDLQWSDSETLAWLPHLLDAAKQERLLVVGTVRSEEFDDYDALQAMCDTLRRRGQMTEIALGPLDAAEIPELARHIVGQTLAEQQAHWLARATEGNPLFVIETARLLHDTHAQIDPATINPAEAAHGALATYPMPKTVLAVIDARLARLSKTARTLAEVAATIGRSFTFPVLAAAASMDEAELVDALDELWRRRIVAEREIDAYDFSHDRIRDGTYAGISTLRRRFLHKRVAAALRQIHTEAHGSTEGISAQLGYHYEAAGERLEAIAHYMVAARVALSSYALAEALYYTEQVLTLVLPGERDLQFEALLLRDHAYEVTAKIPVWEANIERMRQFVATQENATADADSLLSIRRRAIVAERAARATPRLNDPMRSTEYAREAVYYALMTGDVALQARCHLSLALRVWYISDFAAAIYQVERAIDLARSVDASDTLASALELRAQTHMFNGGSAHTISKLLEEAIFHFDKIGNLMGRVNVLNKLGYLYFAQGTGEYAAAEKYLLDAIVVARQIGATSAEISPQRNLGVLYTCMGNYAAAESHIDAAQALHYTMGDVDEDATLLNYRGFTYLNQGRLADALAVQQRAQARLTAASHQQWRVKSLTALAWIHYRLGNFAAAHDYAEQSLAQCRTLNERRQLAYTYIIRGILYTEAGDLAAARPDFEEARTILHGFEMFNRAIEAEIGLAYLDFLQGSHEAAREASLRILAHLETHPLDFTEDVCQVLLICARLFANLEPCALPRLAHQIEAHFATRTATLDAATRILFWQMPAHIETRAFLLQPVA